jgi:uncharacterized protein (TIGR03435 family)
VHIVRSLGLILMARICSTQTAQLPFEVASIRANHSGEERSAVYFQAGRFVAENASLKAIIAYAYHVKDFQISGGPSWIDSEKFNITAKEENAVAADRQRLSWKQYTEQLELMVQSSLADRFQLRVIHKPRKSTILALVTAKGGPKLERSSRDGYEADFRGRRGQLLTKGVSLAQLADFLSWMPEVGVRKVVDQTGFDGNFDLTLRWSFERSPATGGPPEIVQPDAPSIFNAIQEQLGLKLEPTKGLVDYLIIDHVERPSEN